MLKYFLGVVIVVNCFFVENQTKKVLVSSPDGAVTAAIGLKNNKHYTSNKDEAWVQSWGETRSGGTAIKD